MKKLILSLLIASAAMFGFGTAASAQYGDTTTSVSETTTTVAGDTTTTAAPGELPTTGTDGVGTTTMIAIGLLVVGLGLFVVTRVRRGLPNTG